MFWCDYNKEWKSQSFSSDGAQHQNARAERAIQTIMHTMVRTFLVHASLYRTERGSDDLSLSSFTVKLSDWVYNQVPNVRSGLTPLELITRERSDNKTSSAVMCGVVRCLSLKPNYRMTRNFQDGIDEIEWVNLLDFQTNTLLWWLMFGI